MDIIKGKAVLLINSTFHTISRYNTIFKLQENLLRLVSDNCCKKCDTFNGLEVYEWVKEHTLIQDTPIDFVGNFIVSYNEIELIVTYINIDN